MVRNRRSSGVFTDGWLHHPRLAQCCLRSVTPSPVSSNDGTKPPAMAQPESREAPAALLGERLKGAALHGEGKAGSVCLGQRVSSLPICSCSLKVRALSSADSLGPTRPGGAGARRWPGTLFGLHLSQEVQVCPRYCRAVIFRAQAGRGAPVNHSHCPLPPHLPSPFLPFWLFPMEYFPTPPALHLLQHPVCCRKIWSPAAASPELCGGGIGQR